MTSPTVTVTKLPTFLEITDAQRAVSEKIQADARQALVGRVQANQEEARLVRGVHAEQAARATLEIIASEKRRKGRSQSAKIHLGRLAEAYADQGRYLEAAEAHPDKKKAQRFRKIHEAIERDDADSCNCGMREVRDPASGKTLRVPTANKMEDVFSPRHGRIMPLVECTLCGHLNVRPLPLELARREQVIVSSVVPGARPQTDARLLK